MWELSYGHIQAQPVKDGAGSQAVSSTRLCTLDLVSQRGYTGHLYYNDCCSSLSDTTFEQWPVWLSDLGVTSRAVLAWSGLNPASSRLSYVA